jgi:hypothetical protein
MYAENALNLLNLLTSVPALAANAGLAAGGRASDPSMIHVPLPCAWLLLAEDKPNDAATGSNPAGQVVSTDFIVMLHIPYVSQADLLANQLPLLEATIAAVRGKQAPRGQKWRYAGQKLMLINPDRLVYEQRYSIVGFI